MGDFLYENFWRIIIALVAVVGYIVRIEQGMKRNQERYIDLNNKIEKMETQAEASRQDVKVEISAFRKEMNTNFYNLNETMKEVIFKLGDKADKS